MNCRSIITGILTLGALFVSNAGAVNGIALSTRHAGGCTLFGSGLSMYGDIIRHDIVNNAVVKDTVLYSGKAFYSMFRPDGKRFAFIKYNPADQSYVICTSDLQGHVTELTKSKNQLTDLSALDWPDGDWIYYGADGVDGFDDFGAGSDARHQLRRVNEQNTTDELVGIIPFAPITLLQLSKNFTKESGLGVIENWVFNSNNLEKKLNTEVFNCGTSISPSGRYITENNQNGDPSMPPAAHHSMVAIWDWQVNHADGPEQVSGGAYGTQKPMAKDTVNRFCPLCPPADNGPYWDRFRWSVNSEEWYIAIQGTIWPASGSITNMALYNWRTKQQFLVTKNSYSGSFGSEGHDFWVDEGPQFDLSKTSLLFKGQTVDTVLLTNGSQQSTIPFANITNKQSWLQVQHTGAGNAQVLVNTIVNPPSAAGEYLDTVIVSDPAATPAVGPVSYTVRLLVGPFTATTVALFPLTPWAVSDGGSIQFTATVKDQFGYPKEGALVWQLQGPAGATLSQSGRFVSGSSGGVYTVTVNHAALTASTTVTVGAIPSTNLVFWVKADSGVTRDATGKVSAWQDLSGAGHSLTGVSGSQPSYTAKTDSLGGQPSVQFNGDQKLTFTQLDMTNFTVCAVYRSAAASKPFHFWLGGALQGLTAGNMQGGYTGWGAWNYPENNSWRLADATPLDWGQVTITNGNLYRNGVETAYQQTGTLASLAVSTLGSRPDVGDQGFVGGIAEVLVYDTHLPDADRQKVEAYLTDRWGLGSANQPITVTTPNGGETYNVGQTIWIDWKADTEYQVGLFLSVDNGMNWFPFTSGTIDPNDDGWQHYGWTIPATLTNGANTVSTVTNAARVKAEFYNTNTLDVSNGTFTIQPAGSNSAQTPFLPRAEQLAVLRGTQLMITVPWEGAHRVELVDIGGATVQELRGTSARSYQIPTDRFPAGIYLVRLQAGEHRMSSRILLMR